MIVEAICGANRDISYQREFNSISNKIAFSYSHLLNAAKFKYKGLRKILIDLSDKDLEIFGIFSKISPMWSVSIFFDYKRFDQSDEIEQKKMINDSILNGLNRLAIKYSIEAAFFEKIHSSIIKFNFNSFFFYGNIKYSKDKKHYARILIETNKNYVLISSLIYNSDGYLIGKTEHFMSLPHEYFYRRLLGKTVWRNNQFVLYNVTKEISFITDIDNYKSEIVFKPKNRTQQNIIDELKTIDFNTTNKERETLIKKYIDNK